MPNESLVVTLRCGGPGWRQCEDLRQRFFPADRNLVPAHVALFHQLPGEELAAATTQAREISGAVQPFQLRVADVRSLGRGVAYQVESPELLLLHRKLSETWQRWLIPQDRARFSPHVTLQNKVTPAVARETLQYLQSGFAPFPVDALGIELWHYRNGPWEPAAFVPFAET